MNTFSKFLVAVLVAGTLLASHLTVGAVGYVVGILVTIVAIEDGGLEEEIDEITSSYYTARETAEDLEMIPAASETSSVTDCDMIELVARIEEKNIAAAMDYFNSIREAEMQFSAEQGAFLEKKISEGGFTPTETAAALLAVGVTTEGSVVSEDSWVDSFISSVNNNPEVFAKELAGVREEFTRDEARKLKVAFHQMVFSDQWEFEYPIGEVERVWSYIDDHTKNVGFSEYAVYILNTLDAYSSPNYEELTRLGEEAMKNGQKLTIPELDAILMGMQNAFPWHRQLDNLTEKEFEWCVAFGTTHHQMVDWGSTVEE